MSEFGGPARRTALIDGVAAGHSARVVAAACHASVGAVLRRAKKEGLVWARFSRGDPRYVKKEQTPRIRRRRAGGRLAPQALPARADDAPEPLGAPGDLIDGCKYLHGEAVREFRQCGAPRLAGKPYCAHHAARAYVKVHKPDAAAERRPGGYHFGALA